MRATIIEPLNIHEIKVRARRNAYAALKVKPCIIAFHIKNNNYE